VLVASVAHVSNDWKSNFAFASLVPALVLISSLFYKSRKNRQSAHVHEDPNTLNDHKAQIYFGIIMATYVMSEILISTRLALYVRRTQLLDLAHSSLFVSYFFMFLLMGRIFFSFVKFRFPLRTQLMTSLILTLGCFLLGFWKSTQFFALCGLCMAPFYPLALTYASELFPASKMNSALSYILALSSFFIVIMNLTVGWVTDHFGIEQALWVGFVGALISLVLLFSLPVRFKKWFD
jgi:fucose permease